MYSAFNYFLEDSGNWTEEFASKIKNAKAKLEFEEDENEYDISDLD